MSLTTISRIALHSTALYFSFYAFNNLHSISELTGIAIESQYGGHYAFLTIIGLSVATLTQALALAEDLFGSFLPALGFAKRIGSVISLPLESLVSLLYWSILAINKDLLIPPKVSEDPNNPGQLLQESINVPLFLDLSLHAFPSIFLCLDFFLFSKQFPKSVKPGLITVFTTLSYCIWMEHCAKQNGFYPYPLLNEVGPVGRPLIYLASSLTFLGINVAAQRIHDSIWSNSTKANGKAKGKKRE